MWVRGLKLSVLFMITKHLEVAPYVGAWIETMTTEEVEKLFNVAPYVGAWIETNSKELAQYQHGRTLCGCVD